MPEAFIAMTTSPGPGAGSGKLRTVVNLTDQHRSAGTTSLAIPWPVAEPLLSDSDRAYAGLMDEREDLPTLED